MGKIAYIFEATFVYWQSIILTFAVATAVCAFLALYLWRGKNGLAAALAVSLGLVLSPVLARLVHWYCQSTAYASFTAAMTDDSSGGYALMGVFFACILTACLLRLSRATKDMPEMLDCMFLAGMAGIAVGRLALLYTASDRGMLLTGLTTLPFASTVVNTITGAVEYRLSTFMIQSMVAGLLFLAFLLFWLTGWKKGVRRSGDTALLGLAFYGTTQIVLDSTRYDPLFLRSNGFVSVVQILGTGCLLTAIITFSVRMVKAAGWKKRYIVIWVVILALLGGAGYMEYYVQRHGDQAFFAYSIMSACLGAALMLTALIYWLGARTKAPAAMSGSD